MSISRKLKDLIVAFGGAQSAASIPGTRIDTLIGKLADFISTGTLAVLPNVTGSDNGKVLKVIGGVWSKGDDSGSVLPIVSGTDNGKVLGVAEGVWAAVPVPIVPPFDIPIEITESEGVITGATTTVSFADAKAARAAGKTLRAVVTPSGTTIAVYLYPAMDDSYSDPDSMMFSGILDASESGGTPAPELKTVKFSADGVSASSVALT